MGLLYLVGLINEFVSQFLIYDILHDSSASDAATAADYDAICSSRRSLSGDAKGDGTELLKVSAKRSDGAELLAPPSPKAKREKVCDLSPLYVALFPALKSLTLWPAPHSHLLSRGKTAAIAKTTAWTTTHGAAARPASPPGCTSR